MKRETIFFILQIFFSSLFQLPTVKSDSECVNNASIFIIGAGPSGIAAASKLFQNGFCKVTILEAEDRIGGRIYTAEFANYSVDLGGQWVHGQNGNTAYELANPLGLLDSTNAPDFGFEQEIFDSKGKPIGDSVSKKLWYFFIEKIYDAEFDENSSYESIGDYANKIFDEYFKDDAEILSKKSEYLHFLESMAISSDSAENWRNVSTFGSMLYKTYPGDQVVNWKTRGYSTILDILMKRYPNPKDELPILNNTILNTEVTSIDYLNVKDGLPILITTMSGKLYKADHVIVTVSLGVLKEKYKSLFIPPLPDYKISAIEGIGYGSLAKIYFYFDRPFWKLDNNKRLLQFSFVWNDLDRKIINSEFEKKWLAGMYGAMTVEHKPNLLLMWITGKQAKAMEALSEDKVFRHAVENLHRFLGKAYNLTDPVAMLRSTWYANPHFRGTYSYRSVETHKRKVFPEMLERPLSPDNLTILFGGEATDNDRFSTVDGAIRSGWKAAGRIIDYYKNKKMST